MGKRANGEGTVSKRRDGRWCARLSINTPGGIKRRAFYGKTRKEAMNKMLSAMGEAPESSSQKTRRMTVSEWLDSWLDSTKSSISPHTYERYEQVVKHDLKPEIGAVRLTKLSSAHIEDFRDRMLGRCAPATVKYAMGVLSAAMNRARSRNMIQSNPVSHVRRPKDRLVKMRPISADQARRLIEGVRGTRREALYAVAAKLGLRQGELLGLFWSDVDFSRGTLSVSRSVDTHAGGSRWGETKTGEGRTIVLSQTLLSALERHRKMQAKEKLSARRWDDERLLFPNQRGGVHRRNSVMRLFHEDLKLAKLPKIRFHDLRHTAATLMLQRGIPVHVVSQILGHKDPAMTLRRYSHVLSDVQQLAAEKIDSYGW